MDLRDFLPAVKYGVSLANSSLGSTKILLGHAGDLAQEATFGGAMTIAGDGTVSLASTVATKSKVSYGTAGFTIEAAGNTGTFAVVSGCQILGWYSTTATGSPTIQDIAMSNASGVVTWTIPQGSGATTTYVCVYLKA